MGIVYEAEQLSLRRKVALKILPPGLGLTPQAIERFEREARAAAKLHHTNIVPVYAIGATDGCNFYAMELVDGQSLSAILDDLRGGRSSRIFETTVTQLIADMPTRPAEIVRSATTSSLSDTSAGTRAWFDAAAKLLSEVAEALHYAHGLGIVHRDVKPSNLLLSRDGRLCLTDFGLAQMELEPGMTASGSLLGTPAYMSPEQIASGSAVKVDHRTDVYSLGVVLYEVLTLQRPFQGEGLEEVLTGILTQEPKAPRRVNPRVPADLETICLKAMEKNPDRRYRTAAELAADLRAYGQRGLISARRAGPLKRAAKWMRRHPVASIATAAVAAIAILGGVAAQQRLSGTEANARRLVAEAELHLREGTFRQGLAKVEQALAMAPHLQEATRSRARLLLELGALRELAKLAGAILATHPDDWEANAWLAFAGSGEDDRYRLADIPVAEHVAAVAKVAPDTRDVWYLKGLISASQHEAVRSFDRALEIDPGNVWARYGRAMAYRKLCKFPEAIADLEFVIAMRPRSARGRLGLADVYAHGMHDPERGLVECDKAAAIDPADPVVYHDRGFVFRQLGRREEHLADLTKAVELAPWNAVFRADFANLLLRFGRREDALAEAERAVELEPNLNAANYVKCEIAWALRRKDVLRSAIEAWRERADRWADRQASANSFMKIADSYRRLGEPGKVVAAVDRGQEIDPHYFWGLINRRRYQWNQGKARLEANCDLIAQLEIDEPQALIDRGYQLARACSRIEGSLADFDRAIAMAPKWADAYSVRGDVLREFGRFREAIADQDRAVELAPKWPAALFARALAHAGLERWREALSDLDHAFALGYASNDARRLQASALAHLGREEEAVAALKKTPVPTRAWLLFKLGRLDGAMEAIDKAIEANPLDSWSHAMRAKLLAYAPGGCARAKADLAEIDRLEGDVIELGFEVLDARVRHLAWSCPALAQAVESVKVAEQFAAGWPGSWQTHFDLGLALFHGGRTAEADAEFRTALAFPTIGENLEGFEFPTIPWEDAGPRFWLAITEAKLGRNANARRSYALAVERMRKTWPTSIELVRLKDEAARAIGQR